MIKTYSEDIFEKKRQRTNIILYVGCGVAVGYGVIGMLYEYKFSVMIGLGIVVAAIIISSLVLARVMMNFVRRGGGFLEVENKKVVAYHENPFVYDRRTLKDSELVPLQQTPIFVERTLRLPVYGNIISYRIACSACVVNNQKFYDTFLHPEKRLSDKPESVLRTCVAAFLQQNKRNIVDLCMDTFGHIPTEERGEYVEDDTRSDVAVYLREEFKAYGMCLCEVHTSCSLKPVVIE